MSNPAPEYPIAPVLERLKAGRDLNSQEAGQVMLAVVEGRLGGPSLAAFLTTLRSKGESVVELVAFASVLRAQATPVRAPANVLDTCGTGGDGSATFNISTAAALVAAGMGIPVAKHGNRSVSSRSGSADVLQALGVKTEAPVEVVERCLREAGIGFLFAPALHPGVKHAAAVRKELGVRTVFNLLGPLANPARAGRQVLGVFDPIYCERMARALLSLGSHSALVVSGAGPGGSGVLDEVSPWGRTTVARLRAGAVQMEWFEARSLGIAAPPREALAADTPQASAQIIRQVLDGQAGPAREVVLLNASAAAQVGELAGSWEEGLALAEAAIDSGKAKRVLEQLVRISNAG